MRRRQRDQCLSEAFQRPPRPKRSALQKIKAEAVRIGLNGTRQGFKFAERLFTAMPELRSE